MAENWETIDTRADTYGGPWGNAATERVADAIMGEPLLHNAARSLARDKVAEPFITLREWALMFTLGGDHYSREAMRSDKLDIAKLDGLIKDIENVSSAVRS
jgi:hypothetical protein